MASYAEGEMKMKTYPTSWLVMAILACAALSVIILASQPGRAAGPWYVAPGGSDGDDCLSSTTTCATINGALNKPGFVAGDTILVATGVYTGTGTEVVLLDKSATISGGWDASFTAQSGTSTIDGQGTRQDITVNSGITAIVERFAVQNGYVGDYSDGGGIRNSGTLILDNSTVSGNTATSEGGGILNYGGTLTLNNSTVSGNTANGSGGGISNDFGTATLNNSTVSGNTSWEGGGLLNYSSTLTLNNSTVSGNTANDGGGISDRWGTLTLNNTTVSGNTATSAGGGIYHSGTLTLNNSTVSGNTANGSGGGISIFFGGTVTLQNSILGENTAGSAPDCAGTIGSAGYNLVGNTSGCAFTPTTGDLTNIDPELGPLQDYGGSTLTHALLPGSPAIDAGNPAGCMGSAGLLATDQRGFYRPVDGDSNGTAVCDIGAYEFQQAIFLHPAPQTGSGALGATVEYPIQLSNWTMLTDTYSLVLGPHAWQTTLSTGILGPLSAGISQTFTVTVTIPPEAAWYQTDTVVITATSVTSPTVYSDTATITTQAYAPPQISVSPDVLTNTQDVNEIVTQPLTISNGNGVTLTFNLAITSVADDFSTDSGLWIYGQNAYRDAGNGYVVLTELSSGQVGTLWLKDQVEQPFSAEFRYRAGGGSGSDGFVFMFYKDNNYVPDSGGCLGFGARSGGDDCTAAGYGIEFDSYGGNPGDPSNHHIALIKDSTSNHLAYIDDLRVNDNEWHHVKVEIETGSVTVELDGEQVLTWQGSLDTSYTAFGFGGATGGGTDWHIIDDVILETAGGSPEWLTAYPISGTVSTDSSLSIQVTFNATNMQPGEYTTNILVWSNDPLTPSVTIPVTMTVLPTPSMGWVDGTVNDATTGDPLTATIIALGQPYIITTKPDGSYKLWLEAGSYTLQASAAGYVTQTASVTITAQLGITRNFALVLNVPVLDVSPTSLAVTHYVGDVTTRALTITNSGTVELMFNIATGALSNGLVAYYPFNGNADDESGNGNDGTTMGATLTTDRFGNPDSAYSFDGADDYIQLPSFILGGAVSIEAWVCSGNPYANYARIIDFGNGPNNNIILSWYSTYGTMNWEVYQESTPSIVHTEEVFPQNEWIHVAATIDGDGNGYIYWNGVLKASGPILIPLTLARNNQYIAKSNFSDPYFDGLLDEIIVYNRALSAQEIQTHYLWGLGDTDVTWLSTAPVSGTVPGNNSVPVQVTFDATDLQPDTYTTTLYVLSNDPLNPMVTVPVTMTVVAPVTPTAVTISGPDAGWTGESQAFTALVEPISTALPITYTWQATGQDTVTHTDGITDTVTFTWQSLGAQVITVTATNVAGSMMDTHIITITIPSYPLYLPIIQKGQQTGNSASGVKPGTVGFLAVAFSGGTGVGWWLRRKRY
jgi:hypothetical protein